MDAPEVVRSAVVATMTFVLLVVLPLLTDMP